MTTRRASSDGSSDTETQGPAAAPAVEQDGAPDVLAATAAALAGGELTREQAAARLSEALGVKVLLETPAEVALASGETDLSGLYELTAHQWDEPFVELKSHPLTGQLVEFDRFKRHSKGDLVRLSHLQAKRLLKADAVAEPGARETREAERVEAYAKVVAEHARQARERVKQVRAVADDRASVVEQWKAGADVGEQRRAELAKTAQEAWDRRPQTDGDVIDRLHQAGLG